MVMDAYADAKDTAKKKYDAGMAMLLRELRWVQVMLNLPHRIVMGGYAFLRRRRTVGTGPTSHFTMQAKRPKQRSGLGAGSIVSTSLSVTRRNTRKMLGELSGVTGLSRLNLQRMSAKELQGACWKELRARKEAQHELMGCLMVLRQKQHDDLAQAREYYASVLEQIDQISTQLWRAWQISSEIAEASKGGGGGAQAGSGLGSAAGGSLRV